jgi:transposase
LTYQLGHDYSFKTEQRVSILTLDGRVVMPYTGYAKHVALIQHGAQIGAAKLWYDKPRKQFYLLVSLEVKITDPTLQTHRRIVGVDVGQRYLAVKVDACCTSQACPRCGHTTPANRPAKGLLFVCQACGLVLHADLIGARNIALRTLLARQDWVSTGVLSERPDVSDDEAKAAQRRRYAELRWSLDTSPRL